MITRHIQPDGTTVSLDFRDAMTFDPWQSQVHLDRKSDGRIPDSRLRRTFHVTHAGNYDWMIATRFNAAPVFSMSHGGGTFLVAGNADKGRTQGLLLWRGPYHEVQTYIPVSEAFAGAKALDRMAGLTFHDSPEGLVIEPDTASGETVRVFESFTFVPEVASFTVQSPSVALGYVPVWRGASVPAGEVWRGADEGEAEYLVVGSPTAVMIVMPVKGDKSSLENCLGVVQQMAEVSIDGRKAAS